MKDTITVIGAGPVGIMAALYLARRGHPVRLFEDRLDPRKSNPRGGRSINLTLSVRGWHALREVEAEAAVRAVCLPLTGRLIHLQDGSTMHHPYGPNGEALYCTGRNFLIRVLTEIAAKTEGITITFGQHLTSLDPASGRLTFESHEVGGKTSTIEASHVLVADGSHSTAREHLIAAAGGESRRTYVGYWYKEIDVPSARGSWPLDPEATHIWPRTEGLLSLFPNLDRSFSGALFMPFEGRGKSFGSLATQADLRDLFDREFPNVSALSPKLRHRFFSRPISPIMSIRNSQWSWRGCYALIGDAAHTVTPVLGQGLNSGFEDCTVLNECLDACPDWASALERYSELRRRDTDVLVSMAENHYKELSVSAADPKFVKRRWIENRLHSLYPRQIAPFYNLIAFHRVPYSRVPEIAAAQERLTAHLVAIDDVEERWECDEVQAPIREYVATAPFLVV